MRGHVISALTDSYLDLHATVRYCVIADYGTDWLKLVHREIRIQRIKWRPIYVNIVFSSKSHKSPGIDQIPAELIKEWGRTIRYQIHKLIVSIWNKEELPEEWKESIIVPIYKKGDKTDCNNYRGISLLPPTYKILSNILLSRLTPYAEEIIGDHQCGFWCNRSTTDHLFCIRQMLEKK